MSLTQRATFSIFAFSLAACTGNLPTNGALPVLDGAQLTSVNAASVGGIGAATIASGIDSINAATSAGTTGAIVKRDTSGNFSANTITARLQGFATGKQGQSVTISGSTLTFGTDGNYFEVSGIGTVTEIGVMDPGTRITARFTSTLTLHHNSRLTLQGKGDLIVGSGDVFELLSLGFGNWMETSRTVASDSSLLSFLTTGPTFAGTLVPMTPTFAAVRDTQNEFSAGVFTAKQAGRYTVSVGYGTVAAAFSSGDFCQVSLSISPPGDERAPYSRSYASSSTDQCFAGLTQTVALAAGTTVRPVFVMRSAVSVSIISGPGSEAENYFRIDRVRN